MKQGLTPVFQTLRALYSEHADKCVVLHDDTSRYYLGTHEVRAKDGYRTDFGGVEIKKAYVSAHLMPMYIHPKMKGNLSVELVRRMQGKSCFNFSKLDERLFDELKELVRHGVVLFELDGRM